MKLSPLSPVQLGIELSITPSSDELSESIYFFDSSIFIIKGTNAGKISFCEDELSGTTFCFFTFEGKNYCPMPAFFSS